jgi:ribonucleases P/MRP protein subunit RPP40
LQSVLDGILDWCDIWQLSVNVNKCVVLHLGNNNVKYPYFIRGFELESVESISDLGFLLDVDLSFSSHINNIVAKARGRCGVFLRSFVSRNEYVMLKFFASYVRPLLEYGSAIWSPSSIVNVARIEGVQRYFTKQISGCTSLSYSDRLKILKLNSLQFRRRITDLLFFFNSFTGRNLFNCDSYLTFRDPSITRGHQLQIVLPHFNYSSTSNLFLVRVARDWNILPQLVFSATSADNFRNKLLDFLIDPFVL